MAYRAAGSFPLPGDRLRRAMPPGGRPLGAGGPGPEAVERASVEAGALRGVVREPGGERVAVFVLADLLGPWWRARWLEEVGPEAALDPGDARHEALAAAGMDPVPPPRSLRARCTHPADVAAAWCEHAAALAERLALALDGGRLELLWRLRGLTGGDAPITLAAERRAPADGAERATAAGEESAVDDHAFWGSLTEPLSDPVEVWREAPAAILRLGPLPAARGQAQAVEPLVAHYRRVRDALSALMTADARAASAAMPRRRQQTAPGPDAPSQEKDS